MPDLQTFKRQVLDAGILDPEGVHHEFARGTHGRKLDFDLIAEDTALYKDWVALSAAAIRSRRMPFAVLGIANGTNRLARDVARKLDVMVLYTRKVSAREVALTKESLAELANSTKRGLVIAIEDVGTTGGTAYTGIHSLLEAGIEEVEGQFTWKRTDELPAFSEAGLTYQALIDEPLPTYTAEQCSYCAQGWKLIPHAQ